MRLNALNTPLRVRAVSECLRACVPVYPMCVSLPERPRPCAALRRSDLIARPHAMPSRAGTACATLLAHRAHHLPPTHERGSRRDRGHRRRSGSEISLPSAAARATSVPGEGGAETIVLRASAGCTFTVVFDLSELISIEWRLVRALQALSSALRTHSEPWGFKGVGFENSQVWDFFQAWEEGAALDVRTSAAASAGSPDAPARPRHPLSRAPASASAPCHREAARTLSNGAATVHYGRERQRR